MNAQGKTVQNPSHQPLAVYSLVLEVLMSALKKQVFTPVGKLRLTPFVVPYYPTDFPTPNNLPMSKPACQSCYPCQMADKLMSSQADFPAKMFLSLVNEQGLKASVHRYSLMLWTLWTRSNRPISCLKMSQVSSHQMMAKTYKQSLKRLPNAGMWDFGECLTAVISESPKTP